MKDYYFIKVSKREHINAKSEKEAVLKAIQEKIVDINNPDDYIVVSKDIDGGTIAGMIDFNINWADRYNV